MGFAALYPSYTPKRLDYRRATSTPSMNATICEGSTWKWR
jgi:hypothetical protein